MLIVTVNLNPEGASKTRFVTAALVLGLQAALDFAMSILLGVYTRTKLQR